MMRAIWLHKIERIGRVSSVYYDPDTLEPIQVELRKVNGNCFRSLTKVAFTCFKCEQKNLKLLWLKENGKYKKSLFSGRQILYCMYCSACEYNPLEFLE